MLVLSVKFCFCLLGFFITVPTLTPDVGTALEMRCWVVGALGWICCLLQLPVFIIPGMLFPASSAWGPVQSTSQPIHPSTCKLAGGLFLDTVSRHPLCSSSVPGGGRADGVCWLQLASGLLSLPFRSYSLRFRNSGAKIAHQNIQMGKGLPSLPAARNGICRVSSFLFMEAFGLYASVRTGMNFKHVSTEHN